VLVSVSVHVFGLHYSRAVRSFRPVGQRGVSPQTRPGVKSRVRERRASAGRPALLFGLLLPIEPKRASVLPHSFDMVLSRTASGAEDAAWYDWRALVQEFEHGWELGDGEVTDLDVKTVMGNLVDLLFLPVVPERNVKKGLHVSWCDSVRSGGERLSLFLRSPFYTLFTNLCCRICSR
jgi:hypothetical protein